MVKVDILKIILELMTMVEGFSIFRAIKVHIGWEGRGQVEGPQARLF